MRDKQRHPKILKRVGKMKTQSFMRRAKFSIKVWFLTLTIDLREVIRLRF